MVKSSLVMLLARHKIGIKCLVFPLRGLLYSDPENQGLGIRTDSVTAAWI